MTLDAAVAGAISATSPVESAKLDRDFSPCGRRSAPPALTKSRTITTATQSGIFLPVEVVQPLVPTAPNTFRQAFTVYGLQPLSTPMTSKINVPVLTATAGGAVSETANTETENEPGTSGSIVSQPATYHSGTWFSNLNLPPTTSTRLRTRRRG